MVRAAFFVAQKQQRIQVRFACKIKT